MAGAPPFTPRTAPPWKRGGLPAPSGQYLPGTDGAGGGAIGVPGSAGLPQSISLERPVDRPIPDAQFFNINGQSTSTIAEAGVFIAGADLTIEDGFEGRIDSLIFSVQNLQPTSNLSFALLFNNNTVPGFDNIKIFPANAALYQLPFNIELYVPTNTRIRGKYTNGDGATYELGMFVEGFFWSVAAGRQWLQTGVSS